MKVRVKGQLHRYLGEFRMQKRLRKKYGASFGVKGIVGLAYHNHVGCLEPFGPLGDVELDFIALVKGFEAIPLNGGEVNEDIISVVSGNESKALLLIKPFYTTFSHYNSPPFHFELK